MLDAAVMTMLAVPTVGLNKYQSSVRMSEPLVSDRRKVRSTPPYLTVLIATFDRIATPTNKNRLLPDPMMCEVVRLVPLGKLKLAAVWSTVMPWPIDGETLGETELEGLADGLPEVVDGEILALGDRLTLGESELLGLRLLLAELDGLSDGDSDGLVELEAEALGLRLADGESETLGLRDALAELDGDRLAEGDSEALGDKLGLTLGDTLAETELEGLRLTDWLALGDKLGLTLTELLADGLSD